MSDPIAEAAAHLSDAAPSSTEPQPAPDAGNAAGGASDAAPSEAVTSAPAAPVSESAGDSPNADAGTSPAGAATPAITGNVLLNAAPVVDAPVLAAPAAEQKPEPEAEPMAREWHLMSLEAKFASALAKLRNAERVSVYELESIYVHIKAVI